MTRLSTSDDLDTIRTPLSRSGLRCGEAALEAFGITARGVQASWWGAVCRDLGNAGYSLSREVAPWWGQGRPSLARFVAGRPCGDYIINTADHVMALRDGQLTDTDLGGGGLRRVLEAHRVTRAGQDDAEQAATAERDAQVAVAAERVMRISAGLLRQMADL